MAMYFPEKMSNQESLYLSWNDPNVNPTRWGGVGVGGGSGGGHILNLNQTASPAGCTQVQQPLCD